MRVGNGERDNRTRRPSIYTTHFGVVVDLRHFPWVARSAQPRAVGQNPFRIPVYIRETF
jgi:extradiol dioxygenase family protein